MSSARFPKVSVIMPVFNSGPYLAQAIDSILNQDFTDFELLVLNDGSSDNSLEVARRFEADRRVKVINRNENRGLVFTLNEGIQRARGIYLARMDADDISRPTRLSKQVHVLDSNPKIGICGTWWHYMDSDVTIQAPVSNDDIKLYCLVNSPFGHPTVMIRSSILSALEEHYRQEFYLAEDYELWTRVLDDAEGMNISEVLLDYRIHSGQLSYKSARQIEIADQVRLIQLNKITPRSSRFVQALFLDISNRRPLGFVKSMLGNLFFKKLRVNGLAVGFASVDAFDRFIEINAPLSWDTSFGGRVYRRCRHFWRSLL